MTGKPDPVDKPALLHREERTTPDREERIRRGLEAFDRGDFDPVLALYGPDAVWDMSPMGMGVFAGREAIRSFYEDWLGSYETFEQALEEFRDLGSVTFAVILQRARPRGSAGVVAFRYAAVGIWREGLAERNTVYTGIDEARAIAERLAKERGSAVSRENVEIVSRGWERFVATGELLEESFAPDFVLDMSKFRGWPEQHVYEGADGWRRFLREWTESFEEWRIGVEAQHDAGEKVVTVCRQHGRAKASGLPVDMLFAMVITLRDGLQTRIEMYADPAEALQAAALER